MHYIKFIESKDNTKLYMKVNDIQDAKANIIIAHGVAEHLDRYDEITAYLNEAGFSVIRYDRKGMVVLKASVPFIAIVMKLSKI